MKNNSGIYKITNIINNKIYIGSAQNIKDRKRTHFYTLRNGTHSNNHLQKSFDKYGEEYFIFEVIEIVENSENLIDKENYYINLYNSNNPEFGYNIRKEASSNLGIKYSDESKERMSIKAKGRKYAKWALEQRSVLSKVFWSVPENREKMSGKNSVHYGKKQSEELVEKRMSKLRGRIDSAESRLKRSKTNRNHPFFKSLRLDASIVLFIKNFLRDGISGKEIHDVLGYSETSISRIKNNKLWGGESEL